MTTASTTRRPATERPAVSRLPGERWKPWGVRWMAPNGQAAELWFDSHAQAMSRANLAAQIPMLGIR